ncbi:unannotated protein [freshwater metagenome]|uniref:Unannotated protein n=1 Tax=freshwater metagenome TaxID=449393 RepID=A0A6J7R9B9_9ZZZZ|nr:hypothetical protein [Actinomycetota bacterium]MSW15632.1 hypothetical protein [Actinomycetota bacterium]MSW99231.1 hypothetical protein [Actinomycetota bacterium]MSY82777.1 hypothetical protein [Actinomycetota bacterium]MSZ45916.1 hypothetical protein [Actinomycetota bacterium]
MIKSFLTLALQQEGGAEPGPALSASKAIVYFLGAPVVLFVLITIVVLISSADRKKSSSSLTRID